METRRRDSKSYLLRRELRQQKRVHSVSGGRKAAIYTAYILLSTYPRQHQVTLSAFLPLSHCFKPLLCCVHLCISTYVHFILCLGLRSESSAVYTV